MKNKETKSYIELANDRYEDNKQKVADKAKLERDKFNHQKHKDTKNAILSVIVGMPIFIIILTFTIIWVKILTA